MAEEIGTSPAIQGADTTAPITTEPKKQRAPRQKKVSTEAAAPAPVVKTPRKKRGEKAAEVAAASIEDKPARGRKGAVGAKAAKPAKAVASAAVVSDEFADLIALEEENKALRKALSEKLQTENADLRKKLGRA